MATDTLLRELERQQKYLDTLPPDFSFPLFNARRAVESQRKSGYRSTAAAGREIVDNAIEADAKRIHVIFDKKRGSKHELVSSVAFIDDGSGMLPKMARFALSWGGGTHFDEPSFIGRFGFGLPNASINQTRRVEVYTRTSKEIRFTKAFLDLDQFGDFGQQSVPPPTEDNLPPFIQRYIDRTGLNLDHGTVVVWVNPDRLLPKTTVPLREHLVNDFGVTYRYLLNRPNHKIELVVEGVHVQPVDPLFLLPEGRYFLPPDKGGAQLIDERFIPVKYFVDPGTDERRLRKIENTAELDQKDRSILAIGTFTVRIARFPLGFAPESTKEANGDEDASRRFEIRKTRKGMSFVRAGREVQTLDAFPKSARDEANGLGRWPTLESYAYHWGIEVKFEPELDDIFGITNDKQGVRPIEDFWRVLHEEGIDDLLRAENKWQTDQRHRRKDQAQASQVSTPAELAAHDADVAASTRPAIPDHAKPKAIKEMEAEAEKRVGITARSIEEARIAVDQEKKRRPYRVDYFDAEHAPFFKPEWSGPQIVIKINRKHPFYDVLYSSLVELAGGYKAKQAIDLLMIALAKAELTASEEMELWYEAQREQVWSPFLSTAMKSLKQRLGASEELVEEADAVEPVPIPKQTTFITE